MVSAAAALVPWKSHCSEAEASVLGSPKKAVFTRGLRLGIALRRLLRHLASTLQVRLPALQAGCLHHVYDLQPVCGQLNVALDVGARDCVCNCIREGFMCAAPGAHYPPAGTHDDVHVLRVSP
eukprot:CAMPEP_0170588010 /NCGR_PEP_ID=MMETSP0224-20130122/10597_1 /TAXON_ID=285029 /ORGANISM="Togula jolla, Strain CCCM 725" /LENGTH=122 /DNA_ID=CAMNT_0010911689 /DNA_START=458 /DNA_END=826 /DNA_ORIENTATION=-